MVRPPASGTLAPERVFPLVEAAKRGDLAGIERHFAETNENLRYQALWYAALEGKLDAMTRLLDKGVPVDPPSLGSHALEAASRQPHVAAIELLCRRGANPNWVSDRRGSRPLHGAISVYDSYTERIPAAKALLRCGADPTIPEAYGDQGMIPVIVTAARHGDAELVRMILDRGGKANDVTTVEWAHTPLMAGASYPEIVRLLLRHGADAKRKDGNGQTALAYAACPDYQIRGSIQPESVRLLIQAGSPVNEPQRDYHGELKSPLQCAAERGSIETVRMLLKAGADPDYVDAKGRTALGMVARADNNPNLAHPEMFDLKVGQRQRYTAIAELLVAHKANAAVDPEVARLARPGEAVGNVLLKGLEPAHLAQSRRCIDSRPRALSRAALASPPAAPPRGDTFTQARVVRLKGPAPYDGPSISPDGRYVLMIAGKKSRPPVQVAFYAPQEDRWLEHSIGHTFYEDIEWSVDPPSVQLARSYQTDGRTTFDLRGAEPAVNLNFTFRPAGRAGSQPCLKRDKEGNVLMPGTPGFQDDGREDPAWSPLEAVKYQLVPTNGRRWTLSAIKGNRSEPLVTHGVEWVQREWRKWREDFDEDMKALAKEHSEEYQPEAKSLWDGLEKMERNVKLQGSYYALSITGQYLYYRVSTTEGGGWFSPPQPVRNFVVDVMARPARVWEIPGIVGSAAWHPNGRELYFVTSDQASRREKQPPSSLAVAQFP